LTRRRRGRTAEVQLHHWREQPETAPVRHLEDLSLRRPAPRLVPAANLLAPVGAAGQLVQARAADLVIACEGDLRVDRRVPPTTVLLRGVHRASCHVGPPSSRLQARISFAIRTPLQTGNACR